MTAGLAQAAAASVNPTTLSVQDPKQLARHVSDLQRQILQLSRALERVPISVGKFITVTVSGQSTAAIPFTSGTSLYLSHELGRPFVGYLVTGQTDFGSLKEVALLAGQTPDKFIALQSNVTAKFNVYVF